MFKQLKRKWQVSTKQFILIICVFAITGTITAYLSRTISSWAGFDETTWWVWKVLLSLIVLIFGYQVIILLVGYLFGQFAFFWNYEKKILTAMRLMSKQNDLESMKDISHSNKDSEVTKTEQSINPDKNSTLKHLIIFASGAGSNAQQIINYFRNSTVAKVALVVCNKPGAGVINIAQKENIPVLMIEKERFFRGDSYLPEFEKAHADLIILAGFLWKIPQALINAFHRRIINIHPALLPKYGGKGMYGQYVHESVLNAGEMESGITIHYVDEHYDHGDVIFQTACPILENDTPETLAKRIHQLEHLHYPKVIEEVLTNIEQGTRNKE
jgi:formyltetrahydrofolate-dependent phosphoribosylglycinamide formyltransferase